jgi:autotransporter-associated beta strand protein
VVDTGSNNITLSGVLSGNGGLVKQGSGTLILSDANTFLGTTTVSNGVLNLAGSITGIGAGTINVAPAGTLKGVGSTAGSVNVHGLVAPGASVGTLLAANATLNGGGAYEFQLDSANSSAGWDSFYVTGLLDVQATSANKFTIKLVSMADASAPGTISDFDPSQNYSWTVATGAGALLNFDPAKFAVDASAFQNTHSGTFSVTSVGNSIVVLYNATGSPSQPVFSGAQLLGNGHFELTFSGTAGAGYSVRASTNVALTPAANWPVIDTGTFGATPVTFVDSNAASYVNRFYLISVP